MIVAAAMTPISHHGVGTGAGGIDGTGTGGAGAGAGGGAGTGAGGGAGTGAGGAVTGAGLTVNVPDRPLTFTA